jgi:hypothetical protein
MWLASLSSIFFSVGLIHTGGFGRPWGEGGAGRVGLEQARRRLTSRHPQPRGAASRPTGAQGTDRPRRRGPAAGRGQHRLMRLRAGLWAWLGARQGLDPRPWPVGAALENCRARGAARVWGSAGARVPPGLATTPCWRRGQG